MDSARARFDSALAGVPVTPVVTGLSFVDPALLPGPGGPARRPAAALAHACAELYLDFAFVPSWEPWALDAVAGLRTAGVVALWAVPGVFTPVLEGEGAGAVLRATERDPGRLAEALDSATRLSASAIDAGIAAGADAIVVADDLAGADGPIASPSFLDAEVFPRLALLAEVARAADLRALLHCDGDARRILALVRDSGFSGVHGDCGGAQGVEPSLEVARAVGIALVGGVPTSTLTGPASGAAAPAATLADGGGLLIADDGGLTSPEQVAALFIALRAVNHG